MMLRSVLRSCRELAGRRFRKTGFAFAVILALALGVGANTATLSLLYGYSLAPLPYPQAGRLVHVFIASKAYPGHTFGLGYDTYAALKAGLNGMAAAGLSEPRSFNLETGSHEAHMSGAAVSASWFTTLDVRPVLGRVFTASTQRQGASGEVVLSYGLWQRVFNGAPDVLGRVLRLNGTAYTIVGVMPARFRPQGNAALWVPFVAPPPGEAMAGLFFGQVDMTARLKPGVTPAQLRTGARAVLAGQIARDAAALRAQARSFGPEIGVLPLRSALLGHLGHRLGLALWVAGLLLALVWFNLANLFIARALARRSELVMRQALGADSWALLRELLGENLLLCVLGGALGLAAGHALLNMLLASGFGSAQFAFPRHIWQAAALIAFALAVLSALVFSLIGLLSIRRDLAAALKDADAHSTGGRGELRVRTAMVTVQLALAAALCTSGAMLAHGLMHLERVRLGFQPAHVLTMQMYFPRGYVATSTALAARFSRLHAAVARLPGVQAASIANEIPFGSQWMCSPLVPYPDARAPAAAPPLMFNMIVDRGYFRTMGLTLRAGSGFPGGAGPQGMLIDAAAARTLFGTPDPVGRTVTFDTARNVPIPKGALYPVRGVVGVARLAYTIPGLVCDGTVYRSLTRIVAASHPPIPWSWYLAVRTRLPPAALLPELRRVLARVVPGVPVYDVRTLHARMAENLRPHRRIVTLALLLAGGALAVAAVGLYAVQSYAVASRRAEFGIRGALGATRSSLLALVLRQALGLLFWGLAIGLAGMAVLGRVFAGALYGFRSFDLPAAILVAAVLSLTTLLAGGIPAWRASRVPPVEALRDR